MDALQDYTIPFTGLKLGKHTFTYHIDSSFFDVFKYNDFESIDCNVEILFNKKTTLFELQFNIEGMAVLKCDLTNEPFEEIINNSLDLIVKLGDSFNEDSDEVLIIERSQYQLNVAQYIYEAIVLALPVKRIHPGVIDGSLKSEVLDKLKEFQNKDKTQTDPRWDKLNILLTPKRK